MEHRPDVTKPRDVLDFNPKDRDLIALIDHTLEDHRLAMQGLIRIDTERWELHDEAGVTDQTVGESAP